MEDVQMARQTLRPCVIYPCSVIYSLEVALRSVESKLSGNPGMLDPKISVPKGTPSFLLAIDDAFSLETVCGVVEDISTVISAKRRRCPRVLSNRYKVLGSSNLQLECKAFKTSYFGQARLWRYKYLFTRFQGSSRVEIEVLQARLFLYRIHKASNLRILLF